MLWVVSRFLLFLLLCAIGTALYMRIVDHDPARWHVDPEEAQPGDTPNDYLVAGYDAVRLDQPAATVAAALNEIALADRNTRLLAGSPAEGMMTYVATSRAMGFPDYVSVAVRETEDGGTRLSLYGRARFGRSDFGVNRERIERWLATLRQRLAT